MAEQLTTNCLGTEADDLSRYLARAEDNQIPLAVSFELTHRCSFRCVHCYLGNQTAIHAHSHRELNTDQVISLLDELVEAGTLFLTLTGGDPMLRPDFFGIYEHAVRVGLLVSVYCNGSLVTEEIITSFNKYPPRAVEVTLYGATEKTFEAITQKPGSFAACMEGVEQLRNAGVRLRLKTMVMTLNCEELVALWEMAEKLGVPFRHDCSIIPALPNEDNNGLSNTDRNPLGFRLSPEQAAVADLSSTKVQEKLEQSVTGKASVSAEHSPALYQCGAGRSSCHITPYGRMQPCIISPQPSVAMTEGLHFQDAWDMVSKEFTAQKAGDDFSCIDCQGKRVCTGCPSAFVLETGDAQEPPPFYCKYAGSRNRQSLLVI